MINHMDKWYIMIIHDYPWLSHYQKWLSPSWNRFHWQIDASGSNRCKGRDALDQGEPCSWLRTSASSKKSVHVKYVQFGVHMKPVYRYWLRCWWRCWWRFWCCSKMGEVCWRAQLRKSVWRETRPTMLTPEPEPSAELSIAPGKVNQHLQPHQPPTTKTISSIISPICVVFFWVKLPIMFGVRWCYNSQPWNGDFQSMGVPPNHPFYVRIFHYKHL